jgi:phosphoribosylanthranilate isomerase
MARTRIKICGVRTPEVAKAAVDAGTDAIGFMFVRNSVRAIDPEEAADIMWGLPPMITTVGVFMNASVDAFMDIEEVCPTHYAQLHGNEDEPTVRACGPAIKAVRYDAATIRAELERWDAIDEVDAILVDGGSGGEGLSFDWAGLRSATDGIGTPIILAGGLTPGNVAEAVRAVRPFAVDVSSGVERERGEKDPALIDAFCTAVRAADRG